MAIIINLAESSVEIKPATAQTLAEAEQKRQEQEAPLQKPQTQEKASDTKKE